MHRIIITPALVLALGACATADVPSRPATDTCKADAGQAYIGQTASSAVGAQLLAATNSHEIRWIAPGMVVTMDYKFGRLTVGYDNAMLIKTVSCG